MDWRHLLARATARRSEARFGLRRDFCEHDWAVHFFAFDHAGAVARVADQPDLLVLFQRLPATSTRPALVFGGLAVYGAWSHDQRTSWRTLSVVGRASKRAV